MVLTTVESVAMPVEELTFPAVTVCAHGGAKGASLDGIMNTVRAIANANA